MTDPKPNPCAPGPCGPNAAHAPIPDSALFCSIGTMLQPTIDMARRQPHLLGLRPYRVSLVWQEYNRFKREWLEVERIELMPVRVRTMEDLSLDVGPAGQYFTGPLKLDEVSPQQVNESILRGYRGGEPWAAGNSEREFFYEVQQRRRCATDPEPMRHRFTLGGAVHYEGDNYEYVIKLVPQIVQRGPGPDDRSIEPPAPKDSGIRL